jgi:hypothetical protein
MTEAASVGGFFHFANVTCCHFSDMPHRADDVR